MVPIRPFPPEVTAMFGLFGDPLLDDEDEASQVANVGVRTATSPALGRSR